MKKMVQSAGKLKPEFSSLVVKLAKRSDEIEKALQLRYRVFVEEAGNFFMMNESGMEQDRYDACCDHLIVTDLETDKVVGTYRLLPGDRTTETAGFYSETEFDLAGLQEYRMFTLELGRSCTAPEYRNGRVIQMLWEGIAEYIKQRDVRYLIGCASLHATDIQSRNEIYTMLIKTGMITNRFGISPLITHRIDSLQTLDFEFSQKDMVRRLPSLMKGYYWLGAEIGGEPAFDPIFHTTDFLTILDPRKISKRYKRHFFIE
ncbi:GNAT family N-acetyltransferase [Aneurinibacillus sp. UBA3580]|jgi:putative hemolysin|uniref:GNAT family N-acetyltransferase n=1 Tax=Aneurinibacillus sp. UBA3580 TaxID=1946041 RepID=UPI00257ED0B0|nr:GNAT family N-acyltransferase [Aneurinibacillus sp. UBA3580]